MNPQELQQRLKNFAYRVINLCNAMPNNTASKIIQGQLIRSSLSSAANYRAACRGQTKKVFIAKLSISIEEIDESSFWLEIISNLELVLPKKMEGLLAEVLELVKILSSSRKTAEINSKRLEKRISTN